MHHPDSPFRFCPFCGGGLEPTRLKPAEPERQVCRSCGYVHYLDPKVAVGTIIRSGARPPAGGAGDRIVLVRRAIEPGYGKWVFPGGYVDRGEDVLVAAAREAREEVNLEVEIDGLVNIYSYAGRTPIVLVYAATATGGTIQHDEESLEAALFGPSEIPWDVLAFRSTREALKDYLQGMLHPIRRSR